MNGPHPKRSHGPEDAKFISEPSARSPTSTHVPTRTTAPRTGTMARSPLASTTRAANDQATAEIGVLAEKLGFAPIKLGGLTEGGLLVQARGNTWGQLIFKELIKFD